MSHEHMYMIEDALENVTITGNFGGIRWHQLFGQTA